MEVIYLLIPIAILFVVIAIYVFSWAVKSDQFDDLEKHGMSVLFDEEKDKNATKSTNSTSSTSPEETNTPNDPKH